MNQTKIFIITISITLLLSFVVTAVPLWADSKEEIKQEKPTSAKWQKKRWLGYTNYSPRPKKRFPNQPVTQFSAISE